MYIINNAVKNLGRNKGRNVIIAVILIVIITATAISVMIDTTSSALIDDAKARFGSRVYLDLDYEKAFSGNYATEDEYGTNIEEIAPETQLAFGESKYLNQVNYNSYTMIKFKELKALDEETDDWQLNGMLIGSNHKNISSDFESKARKLTAGEFYKNPGECIISEQFAKLNGLKVGDSIELNRGGDTEQNQLKVVGIYEDNTMLGAGNAEAMMEKNPNTNRNNEILTDMETAKSVGTIGGLNSEYYLKDPDSLAAFKKELAAKGLPEYYNARTDEVGYNAVIGPIENMSKVVGTFMIVVLILGGIILLLISFLAIRERKYEIGVLRAMGMKKLKVATGFVSEMLILTIICLVVGFGVSAAVSQPVTDSLLANQIAIAEQAQNAPNYTQTASVGMPSAGADGDLKPLSEIDVTLGASAALEITLIALILAILSSLAGIVYITRFEPRKILSERS